MCEAHIPDHATAAASARLATIGPDGPHIVPIVFAVVPGRLVTAIDHKPKSTRALRRLANIDHDPRVSVLIDQYEDDWTRLWWVRVDGTATLTTDDEEAIDALVAKYAQYQDRRPDGPVISVEVDIVRVWSAS